MQSIPWLPSCPLYIVLFHAFRSARVHLNAPRIKIVILSAGIGHMFSQHIIRKIANIHFVFRIFPES